MSDLAISVEGVGKKYRLGTPSGTDRLSEVMVGLGRMAARVPTRWLGRLRRRPSEAAPVEAAGRGEFWALRDVSFEVKRGESVGIIGRNGAGKSTLLKVLSRITAPTVGRFGVRGRVASLLEVGTGFHGELTGRENIFLSGTLLGMSRQEIQKRLAEIVAFAEVDRFLDTPVKHYSSGMQMRLGFAVAAHLRADILIVDEVLAVGDVAFQKKCFGKMSQVATEGRTVLFVSHDVRAVTRFCSSSIVLDQGLVAFLGPTHEATAHYLKSDFGTTGSREWGAETAPGNDVARLRSIRVCGSDGDTRERVDIRHPIGIEMKFDILVGGRVLIPNYQFFTDEGMCAFASAELHDPDWRRRPRPVGSYTTTMWIPGNFLAEGSMSVRVGVTSLMPPQEQFWVRDAVTFAVFDPCDGESNRGDYIGDFPGVVRPRFKWETQYVPAHAVT
ncbi:ABC transporter ATP-binding protein [Frigoriglobus tundricola]|uniref:Teichoic acid export ATP-binding protein TagH n=1 Tax=Frigoriglobus tundricola TaxID=2774151 RepID=A0A6M5Z4U2_9BACT|nr:ABC transporter ATP-binding protein [Frigoriglobus tundricola]QJX00484.1 Teichoic acid export ATP-binding protein TagH [Frigoriglobus tundricola]